MICLKTLSKSFEQISEEKHVRKFFLVGLEKKNLKIERIALTEAAAISELMSRWPILNLHEYIREQLHQVFMGFAPMNVSFHKA